MCVCISAYIYISSLVRLVFICIHIKMYIFGIVFYFFSGAENHAMQMTSKVESATCKSGCFDAEEEEHGHLHKQILHNTYIYINMYIYIYIYL